MTSLRDEADGLAALAQAAFLRGAHDEARARAEEASAVYAATVGLAVRTEGRGASGSAPPSSVDDAWIDEWLDTVYAAVAEEVAFERLRSALRPFADLATKIGVLPGDDFNWSLEGHLLNATALRTAKAALEESQAWHRDDTRALRRHRNDALTLIYDTIDEMLLTSRFADVDRVLARVDVGRLDITLALGFLSITSAARVRLSERSALVARVEARVRELAPDRVDALMDGLGDAP